MWQDASEPSLSPQMPVDELDQRAQGCNRDSGLKMWTNDEKVTSLLQGKTRGTYSERTRGRMGRVNADAVQPPTQQSHVSRLWN